MANKQKYGIPINICGVYKITNKLTGEFYIGASVKINDRISTHFGRESKKNFDHPFYNAIRKYGLNGFKIEVLEQCDEDSLLEREQYFFDLLKPTYNLIRPNENHLLNDLVKFRAKKHSTTPEKLQKRSELFKTKSYRELFQNIQRHRMKSVDMIKDDEVIMTFESMMNAQRWLNDYTSFESKNKVSKIKDVCDGKRKSAFGYQWQYSKV